MPFEIDPAKFKTGNFLLDKVIVDIIKKINKADLNKDSIPDIQEIYEVIHRLLPVLIALNAAIDFNILAQTLVNHPAIKDKEVFKEALLELGKLAENIDLPEPK